MARSRSIPTDFFDDPAIFECGPLSHLVLMSLILFADDHGRGPAGARWLAHKLQLEVAVVQTALQELEQHGLIDCYQVGRHSYYFICHWHEWETLSRPAQPKYPAPPTEVAPSATQDKSGPSGQRQAPPNFSENPPTNPGDAVKSALEEEEEGKKNKKRREKEEEGASSSASLNPNVLAFHEGNASAGQASTLHAGGLAENREQGGQAESQRAHTLEGRQQEMVAQLSTILQLPPNDALSRLIEEFLPDSRLSLIAEADAAREWIADRSRNRSGTTMSLSFFRRWLLREQENRAHRSSREAKARSTSTRQQYPSQRSKAGSSPLSAQAEPNPYKAFFDRRIREIETAFDAGVPMEEILSGRVSYAPSA